MQVATGVKCCEHGGGLPETGRKRIAGRPYSPDSLENAGIREQLVLKYLSAHDAAVRSAYYTGRAVRQKRCRGFQGQHRHKRLALGVFISRP